MNEQELEEYKKKSDETVRQLKDACEKASEAFSRLGQTWKDTGIWLRD